MIWNLKRNRLTQFGENSQKVVFKNNFTVITRNLLHSLYTLLYEGYLAN